MFRLAICAISMVIAGADPVPAPGPAPAPAKKPAPPAAAPAPGPGAPAEAASQPKAIVVPADALTDAKYREQVYQFEQKRLVGAYEANEGRDKSRDEDAIKFLDEAAKNFAGVRGALEDAKVFNLSAPLVIKEPVDPTVFAVRTRLELIVSGNKQPAMSYHTKAANGISKTKGLKDLYAILMRVKGSRHEEAKEAEEASKAFTAASRAVVMAAAEPGLSVAERRHVFSEIHVTTRGLPADLAERVPGLMRAQPSVDKWTAHMVDAMNHHDKAWEARGSGFASTATNDGMRIFKAELPRAAAAFRKAFEESPERPEPAAYLIECAYVGVTPKNQNIWYWFERAFRAQPDYEYMYSRMELGLRPRWGGSVEDLLSFAQAFAGCDRFDTRVPLKLLVFARDACEESHDSSRILRTAGLWPAMQAIFDGYEKQKEWAPELTRLQSLRAAAAWRAGDYAQAKAALDKLGGKFEQGGGDWFMATKRDIAADAYAASGAQADAVKAALKEFEEGNWERAAEQYGEIAGKLKAPANKAELAGVQDRLTLAQAMAEFEGKGVAQLGFAADLSGWRPTGTWARVDDGAVKVTPGKADAQMDWAAPVGERLEVSCEVDFAEAANDPWRRGGVSCWVHRDGFYDRMMVMVLPESNQVEIGTPGHTKLYDLKGDAKSNVWALSVAIWDDRIVVRVNGDAAFNGKVPMQTGDGSRGPYVGLSAGEMKNGAGSVTIRDVHVAELSAPPPGR